MKRCFVLCLFACCPTVFLFAQTRHSGWLASFNSFKTGKKTSIHAEAQLRSTDEIRQVQTLLLRAGLNYQLNSHLTVTAGYAYISNKQSVGNVHGFAPEHRAWEQLLLQHRWSRVFVSHRFRLEQRWLPITGVVDDQIETDGYRPSGRFRYFLRNIIPFQNSPVFTKGPFAAVQNEVFLNVTGKSKVNGRFFDQNRLYLALGYRLRPTFDMEIGYLNQYVLGRTGRTNNHVLQLACYLRK